MRMKYSKTLSFVSLLGAVSMLGACSSSSSNTDTGTNMPLMSMLSAASASASTNSDTSGLMSSASSLLTNPLVEQISSGLGVGDAQAVGGTGALLALANQTLTPSQNSELLQYIPDVSQFTSMIPGVNSNSISNISSLYQAFSNLGLSDSLIPDFATQIIDYLENQGASNGLISALASTWAS